MKKQTRATKVETVKKGRAKVAAFSAKDVAILIESMSLSVAQKKAVAKKLKRMKGVKMKDIKLQLKERLDASCQMRMPPKLFQRLTEISEKKGIARTELIRQILQQVVDQMDEQEKKKVTEEPEEKKIA